ncbi:putative transferase, chloroplastic [Vitis vinifera]|uniref:Putative transferase, chloroplastic n=1 Tax=Vitis vinifera TaxID=29760 RepID=A0A438J6F2_VITVI|nr:putative transferase, chloroplastic [Vitis vinifera]
MAVTVGCTRYLLVGATTPLRRSTSLRSSSSFSSWTWKPNPISFPIQNHAFRSPEKFFTPLAAALPFDLSPPPIDLDLLDGLLLGLSSEDLWLGSLQDTVTEAGAKVSEAGIIETFDNDDEALDAVDNGVVVELGVKKHQGKIVMRLWTFLILVGYEQFHFLLERHNFQMLEPPCDGNLKSVDVDPAHP